MNPAPRYAFIAILAALVIFPLVMLEKQSEKSKTTGTYRAPGAQGARAGAQDGSSLFLGTPKPSKKKTYRLQPLDPDVYAEKDSTLEDAPSDGYQYQYGITYGRRCGRFSLAGRVFPAKQSGEWIVRRTNGGDSLLPTSTLKAWTADTNGTWDAYDVGPLAGGTYELRIYDPKGHLRTVGSFDLDECSGDTQEDASPAADPSESPSPTSSPSPSPSSTSR